MAGAHAPIVMALCAHCVIEDDVFIGIQSLIRKGLVLSREPLGREAVTIGRGSVVGAGSVVTRDVPVGVVVAGNPAMVVRQLEL